MWTRLLLWLLGSVITADHVRWLLNELLGILETMALRTQTDADDNLVKLLRQVIKNETTVEALAVGLNEKIKAK